MKRIRQMLDIKPRFVLPPPPFLVAARTGSLVSSITGLNYEFGLGPSPSGVQRFKIQWAGLIPVSGNISVNLVVGGDFEFSFDSSTWYLSTQTMPYLTTNGMTEIICAVRLKAGLPPGTRNGYFTLSGGGAPDWTVTLQGTVSGTTYIEATGGTVTTDGDYKVHTFNGDGMFTITKDATNPANRIVDTLIVAGGGGGGNDGSNGGGGGAGGYISALAVMIVAGGYTVTVGAGGSGPTSANGSNSSFLSMTAIGGGHGGSVPFYGTGDGGNGGSGGGSSRAAGAMGMPTVGQGNAGAFYTTAGGGGGGAGAVGAMSTGSEKGGNGGVGLSNSITGTAKFYAGGGGGGGTFSEFGLGGNGGGGHGGGSGIIFATPGVANTGGGGGGDTNSNSSNGGSGVVIIRYRFQ